MGQTGWYGLDAFSLFEISDSLSSFFPLFLFPFFLSSDISKEVLHLIFSTVSLFLKMSQSIKTTGKIKNKNKNRKQKTNKGSLLSLIRRFMKRKLS